jgi:Membrane-associated apoptosis protein
VTSIIGMFPQLSYNFHVASSLQFCEFIFAFLCCRLVQFVDSYDPPVQGLQEDLNFVSPRIGEVLLRFRFHLFASSELSSHLYTDLVISVIILFSGFGGCGSHYLSLDRYQKIKK